MPQFYKVGHNSTHKRGMPWVWRLGRGFREVYVCRRCADARSIHYAMGAVEAFCDPDLGVTWPDILGCGSYPFFIVSERTVDAFIADRIGDLPYHPVLIQAPLPKRLRDTVPPSYFWIDGQKLLGAFLDFEASGFVGVQFCPECGTRTDDISATHIRQNSRVYPYAFRPSSWNGAKLFTTDLSPCAFFCTDEVVACARKHSLTNFRFVPIEEGSNVSSRGIDYLRKKRKTAQPGATDNPGDAQ